MPLDDVHALIFDLDDTITNFMAAADTAFELAFADIAEEHHIYIEDMHRIYMSLFEDFYTLQLEGHINLDEFRAYRFSRMFELVGMPIQDDFLDLCVDFQDHYDRELETFPGAIEVLEELDKRFLLGLITNGPTDAQWRKINKFQLPRLMEVILVSGQLGIAKPDPKIFEVALEGLRAAPEQTVMIGNSLEHDHQGAINSGIRFVWMNHFGKEVPEGWPEPEAEVHRFVELRDLFL
jgi:HAD superfamily hydrolase (TIGR01549 family)